jgi:hypothetical protein
MGLEKREKKEITEELADLEIMEENAPLNLDQLEKKVGLTSELLQI